MKNKIATDKLGMQPTNERQHMTRYWPNSLNPQWSRQAVITVSRSTWKTTKIWSRHRSSLYGCDRSPGTYVSELGTGIPNQNDTNGLRNWTENLRSGSLITCEEGLAPSQRPFENGTN